MPTEATPRSDPTAGSDWRAAKKAGTREALRTAALRLVTEHGLEHTTAEEIARAAGVCERTFFNYFETKEDAVIAPDPARAEQMAATIRARRDLSPFEALRLACSEQLTAIEPEREQWSRRIALAASSPALRRRFLLAYATLAETIATALSECNETQDRYGLWANQLASAAGVALRAAVVRWALNGEDLQELLTAAFDQLRAGLAFAL